MVPLVISLQKIVKKGLIFGAPVLNNIWNKELYNHTKMFS